MIVWGGTTDPSTTSNSGAAYNPDTNSWRLINQISSPNPMCSHTAVWTGTEMIVWGGNQGAANGSFDSGAYNPATDTWRELNSVGAPSVFSILLQNIKNISKI